MKFKLATNKISIIGISLLLLSAIAIIFISITESRRINATTKMVEHTQEVLIHSQKLLSLVTDIEAAARGFILTGQKSFLMPVEKNQKEIYNQLAQLKLLTRNNPLQQDRLDSLSSYIDKRILFSNHIVSVRELKGEEAAKAIVETGEGRLYSDQIRLVIDKIQATENVLLAQHKEANRESAQGLNKILWVVFISIFILLALFLQKTRANVFAKRKTKELSKQNAELEQIVTARTEEVVKSKNILSDTFERITDAFIALDKNWRYTYVNKKAGEIFQQIPEEMIGKHIWTEFPEGINQSFYMAYNHAMETQQYMYLEEYYVPYNLWFEHHIYPSEDGLSVFFRDITERKKAEDAIKKSEEKYRDLVDNITDIICTHDLDGRILFVNKAAEKLIGYKFKREQNMNIKDILSPDTRHQFNDYIANIKKEGHSQGLMKIQTNTGEIRIWEYNNTLINTGADIIVQSFTRDITERKKAEKHAKLLTQQLLKAEEIAEFGFLDWNLNTNELVLSPQVNKIYGIPEDVLNVTEFINRVAHPDDKQFVNENLELAIKGIKEYNIDHRIIRGDGAIIWVNARAELIKDANGNPIRLLGTILDITDSKLAEEKLKTYNDQLKELTTHLISIREAERKRIAREIHDELGQQLTAIKMDVAWVDKRIPEETTLVKNKLKNILTLLDESNQSIRRILSELRPGVLDDHGLLDAIKWLGRQFTGNTGIPVEFTTTETEIKLSEPVATCIFRVCQEAFTNITRYALAKKVCTSLSIIDETIIVTIEDDGIGFDPAIIQTKKSFGILGMKERVLSLNGKFELVSSPNQGTKITISLPYKDV